MHWRRLRVGTTIVAFLASACSGDAVDVSSGGSAPAVGRDASGAEVVEYDALSPQPTWLLGPEPLVKVGVDAGEAPYMFTNVGDVQLLPDGTLVVAEHAAKEIRLYDSGGAFLRSIGREGQGPGELMLLGRTTVTGDKIQVWDSSLKRLSIFTLGGELLGSFPLGEAGHGSSIDVAGYFADGSVLGTSREITWPRVSGLPRVARTLFRWSLDAPGSSETLTTIESDHGVWVDPGLGRSRPMPFVPTTEVVTGRESVYASTGAAFEYRRYALDGSLRLIVRVIEPPAPLSEEFLAEFTRSRIEQADETRRQALRADFARMPFPDHFPAIDQLFVDTEENVWVRRYRTTGGGQEQVFHVFGSDGRFAGTIHLPARLDFRAATADRFVGLWRDEMDVQSVRVYELRRR